MIKAVIFDMGGVIIRTIDPAPREKMAKDFGMLREEFEQFVFHSPSSIRSEVGEISAKIHWQTVLKQFGRMDLDPMKVYMDFFSGDALNEELMEYIKPLRKSFRLGLLSNAWVNARETISQSFSFLDCFNMSIFSYEVNLRKPDFRIFEYILNKMNVLPHQSIFIDDFRENIDAATLFGMNAIHFRNTSEAIEQLQEKLKQQ